MTHIPQITLDTGALIALERRKQRAVGLVRAAVRRGLRVTIPAVVLTEWWRGRTDLRDRILSTEGLVIEPLNRALAQQAGRAIADVERATVVDSIVMASAASRGDIVYTSDVDDLERLRAVFPEVRILGV